MLKHITTFVILIFLLFLYSSSFALDSLEVVMTFESTSGAFITSFDGADFNNDGFSDLIISNNSERMLQFYFGSADPDPVLDLEYEIPYDWGSGQPSYAGDLNGDGWNDLVVPIIILDFQLIYIFFGADTINIDFDNPDMLLNSWDYAPDTWGLDWYGKNTGTDFNGDGYDDLIASRNIEDNMYLHKYEIYLGGPDMDTIMDCELPEIWIDSKSPRANGDINGDGYDDLIIFGGIDYTQGIIGIYYGRENGILTLYQQISFTNADGELFYSDINNDSYQDIILATHNPRCLEIYYGSEDFDTEPDIILQSNNSSFGFCGCDLGDFNGDGKNDIVINNGQPSRLATVYTLSEGQGIDDNHESEITNKDLMRVYPNPFMSSTTISFYGTIDPHELSQIKIYNVRGQLVRELTAFQNGDLGTSEIVWDGKDDKGRKVGPGIYLCKLTADKKETITTMVLIR